jgi:hypothetical protein
VYFTLHFPTAFRLESGSIVKRIQIERVGFSMIPDIAFTDFFTQGTTFSRNKTYVLDLRSPDASAKNLSSVVVAMSRLRTFDALTLLLPLKPRSAEKATREKARERLRIAWQPDANVTATDDMFRAEYTATLQRLTADTQATAPVALADTLLRSVHNHNPPTCNDGLQYRLSPPEAPQSANDAHGHHRPPSPPSRPRKRRAQPTSTSTTRVVRRLPTPPPTACSPTPSPALRGRDAFLQDNALRFVDVPADGSCGFTAVAVAMGIIQPPTFG